MQGSGAAAGNGGGADRPPASASVVGAVCPLLE
jgi:hypothetical protein